MPPETHALLGASSAERWIHCPPSARLTENWPDTASEYAQAGRLAHEIAELKARNSLLEPLNARTYRARLKSYQAAPYYDRVMDSSTDQYLEYLKELALSYPTYPTIALETRVDYSDIVPEGFGTADCIMIGAERLDIVDYKNGSGVLVEAENNPQLMLYAAGALRLFAPVYGDGVKLVHLSIVQPNAGGIRDWSLGVEELRTWLTETAAPAAKLAYAGEGSFQPGDWCRFCKAKARCSARATALLGLEPLMGSRPAGASPSPASSGEPLLSDTEVGDVLTRGRGLAAWVKDLEEYALGAALAGRDIAGWKAVEGRGSRDWIGGTDAVFAQLQTRGIDEALLYERKPVSVAGLEKSLGKKAFGEVAEDLWMKSPGKPTLVPTNDKRPAYNAAIAAFEAVSNSEKP